MFILVESYMLQRSCQKRCLRKTKYEVAFDSIFNLGIYGCVRQKQADKIAEAVNNCFQRHARYHHISHCGLTTGRCLLEYFNFLDDNNSTKCLAIYVKQPVRA